MSVKPSRIYLPRSTVSMSVIIIVEKYAKDKDIHFGKALELMVLESATFNDKFEELKKDAPWLDDFSSERKSKMGPNFNSNLLILLESDTNHEGKRWTCQRLADRMIELGNVTYVSGQTISKTLKKLGVNLKIKHS